MDITIYFGFMLSIILETQIVEIVGKLASMKEIPEFRYEDKSFPGTTLLYGRNVTCSKHEPKKAYAGETWTCKDMMINGKRLGFRQASGFGSNTACSARDNTRDADLTGQNDIRGLCMELLRTKAISKDRLWSALISEARCMKSKEARVIFRKQEPGFKWEERQSEYGHVITLQCMLSPDLSRL